MLATPRWSVILAVAHLKRSQMVSFSSHSQQEGHTQNTRDLKKIQETRVIDSCVQMNCDYGISSTVRQWITIEHCQVKYTAQSQNWDSAECGGLDSLRVCSQTPAPEGVGTKGE